MTTIINIIKRIANEDNWSPQGPTTYMSGHMYLNSPFESSDSCGNCNSARCDSCVKVTAPSEWQFSISSDTLYHWIVEEGIDPCIAHELAYSDDCGHTYKGHHLVWPTEDALKEEHPDFYAAMTTADTEVLSVIESYKGRFKRFVHLKDAVLEYYGLEDTFYGHVVNQLEMYWMACGYDHRKACDASTTAVAELTVPEEVNEMKNTTNNTTGLVFAEEDNYPDSDYMHEAEADVPEMDEDVSQYDNYGDLSQDLEYEIACINLTCQGYDVNDVYYYTTDGFGKGTKISIHKFMSPAEIKKATEEYIAERKAAGDTKMENWVSPDVVTTITVLREEMVEKVILDLEEKGVLSVDEVYV